MASWNHQLLKCCILLALLVMVQAQTNRKLLDNNTPAASYSYFKHPSMDSRQDYLPSSHRSLGAQYYQRSPPPPPPKKKG
ncbi:unnamed protein product [Eruca vesicaria subsp. sativa]|uniref:Uncharacterized protein n=1 Tax=Eruca vesicaria subsp. sativa TaxID=29727 RepID=A0ABC8JUX7_ERUVS|nr:unnamed protein product [Eruca vesicaria subsp. sativa]